MPAISVLDSARDAGIQLWPVFCGPSSFHRLSATIESLRSAADLCMWVQLSSCRIGSKEFARLLPALLACPTVLSIDLSINLLPDDAVRQLADSLADGAALPDLISLNLRGNLFGEEGRDRLRELQGKRRLVKVGGGRVECGTAVVHECLREAATMQHAGCTRAILSWPQHDTDLQTILLKLDSSRCAD